MTGGLKDSGQVQLGKDINQLKTDLDTAETDIDTLQTDLDAAEIDIDTLQTDLDAAEVDIDDLEEIHNSAFKAHRDDAQTINDTSWTKVQFDTEIIDKNNEYDNSSNYRFTAKKAGTYHIFAKVIYHSASWDAGEIARLAVYKNGAYHEYLEFHEVDATITQYLTLKGHTLIEMAVDDYLEIYTYHNRGAATSLSASYDFNMFQGYRIA